MTIIENSFSLPNTPLMMLGLLLVSGLLFGMVASKLNMPRIAAYALAGLVWSEDLLGGYLNIDMTSWTEPLTTAALGIIAYLIGGAITISQLGRLGKVITACTIGESFGAVLAVMGAIWLYQPDVGGNPVWVFALMLGVFAASTAPAATVAVIHQYRAKGPLTTTLLGVVALDDVLGIMLFSIMLLIVAGDSVSQTILFSVTEIIGAILLGGLSGWLLAILGRRVKNQHFLLPMVLGAIFLCQGFAEWWHFSPLLSVMVLGFSARSAIRAGGDRLFAPVDYLEELVFIIFFTLAGAHFKLSVLMQGLDLVFIYLFARIAGKIIGAWTAAKLVSAPTVVRKYLGFGVVPQAGIAIGLALSLMHQPELHDMAVVILNVILASTMIYEIFGPLATRYALVKSGEVNLDEEVR